MREILGYNNFCSACDGSVKENGKLICRDSNGKFYGLPVEQVLMAPCMKINKRRTDNERNIIQSKED